ncbi:Arv1, related protein [Toxoplasma gondii GAB2-2007-GAL-DOM2]|uniref:Protein ARV n=6 Tax=Toxoplasma gondii TaxID=5811 RepID=S7V2P8_TOXGG|nr:hypothetical protein TGGT1_231030 [Toxoplasma gondii GT1]KAF4641724.1 hypothetical protein TGRH88_075350 [Toxoplasma gondii]KFG48440.1 Arv1, related protein [Toxoplasma gondii GAB2-2007-GAL-DOM2]PUA92764.1 Arv1, related protein [Toxoplasma gondii TgCATBr9]RQX75904.1 Arv1, related protein [Toxoplasma gondii CAST]
MVICVECSVPLSSTCRRFPPHFQNIRLARCAACGKTADKYVEYEVLLIFIDLLLHKPQAYRHLIFNRLPYAETGVPPSVRNFAVVCILFDTYTRWFLLHASLARAYFQHAKERTAARGYDFSSHGDERAESPGARARSAAGNTPWPLAAEEASPDGANAHGQDSFRRSSHEGGRPCLPVEQANTEVFCQEESYGDPRRDALSDSTSHTFGAENLRAATRDEVADDVWQNSSLSEFSDVSELDYEAESCISVGRRRFRWRRGCALENAPESPLDAEPFSPSPDFWRRTRRRRRRSFWCSPFYLGVGVVTFVAFSLLSSGRDRFRLCSLAPRHLVKRTPDALLKLSSASRPSDWPAVPQGSLTHAVGRQVGFEHIESRFGDGRRRAAPVEGLASLPPAASLASPPTASPVCLGDDTQDRPVCPPPVLQWEIEAEDTALSPIRERKPGSDMPVSQADVHADVLRWLLQSSPLAAWDLQVFIIAQCTLDFFVYLFSAIAFTWVFVRWHYGSRVFYCGWEDAAQEPERARSGRRLGGSRELDACVMGEAETRTRHLAGAWLKTMERSAKATWTALRRRIEASAAWLHALCLGTGRASREEQQRPTLSRETLGEARMLEVPGASTSTAFGNDSHPAYRERSQATRGHSELRPPSQREPRRLHPSREKKADAVSYVLGDEGHAEREEGRRSAVSVGQFCFSEEAAKTAEKRGLRVTFVPRGRKARGNRPEQGEQNRAVIVKYNYLAAALIVSMFGKMATLLMMAWEENLHLQHFVSFFTLTSNVVAVSVFLNGAHPVASVLIVLGAVAAKALARLVQILLLPPLKFPAFGIVTPSLYGGTLAHLSPLSLLSRDAQWAMSFVLDLVT